MDFDYRPWARNEHRRIYVKRGETDLGYFDLTTRTPQANAGQEELLLRAIAQLSGTPTEPPTPVDVRPKPCVVLDSDDLALNSPGETLNSAPSHFHSDEGIQGERLTAGVLSPLSNAGFRLLHSVPVFERADVDHLLIGPPGILVIDSKYTRFPVVVSGTDVRVDGHRKEWHSKISEQAARVHRVLMRATRDERLGPPIPVLSLWAPSLETDRSWIVNGPELARRICGLPAVLNRRTVELLFEQARRRDTWRLYAD